MFRTNAPPRVGIQYPNSVDLVTHAPTEDAYRLILIEPNAWDGSQQRLLQLQEKLNTYLTFALDGEMERRYPDSVGKRIIIRLDLYAPPDPRSQQVIDKLGKAIVDEGLEFECHVEAG